MQKRTREIIALILLLVLGLGVICAMAWYLLVGHSWNVAATNIDDSIGQMKGYTVFLVEGNKPLPTEEDNLLSAEDSGLSDLSAGTKEPVPDTQTAGVESSDEGSSLRELTPDTERDSNIVEDAHGQVIRTISELIIEYQDKGAEVFVIESTDDTTYAKPVLFDAADRSVGVFRVENPARPAAVKVQAKLLSRVNTDFNILVTDDTNLEGASFRDVDIIVFASEDGSHDDGRYGGSSYCVDTPYEGQVEAIIVSPSGVISSKIIDL